MDDLINELVGAANLMRAVRVDGEYWVSMLAAYNSIINVAQKLRESEVKTNEPGNDSADA